MDDLLSLRGVRLRFGGIVALDGVSLGVRAGTITGLIGPNGAGKTTAFNAITRIYRVDEGDVVFDGESLLRTLASGVVKKGIARTFQTPAVFSTMTALENVLVGAHTLSRLKPEAPFRRSALELLDYVGVGHAASRPAGELPYGTLKRVELARALASKPRLLLLDEPAGGLSQEEVADLAAFVRRLRDDLHVTILLVEHHMSLVMAISDHVHVLDFGRRIASGSPQQVQRDPKVIEAYLGGELAGAA